MSVILHPGHFHLASHFFLEHLRLVTCDGPSGISLTVSWLPKILKNINRYCRAVALHLRYEMWECIASRQLVPVDILSDESVGLDISQPTAEMIRVHSQVPGFGTSSISVLASGDADWSPAW